MSYFTYRQQHSNRGYGYDIYGAEGIYDADDFASAPHKCDGASVTYGPSSCSGCCDGYDGKGKDVISTLQAYLNTLGYLSAQPTGQYGSQTYAAVRKFQEAFGVSIDGRIGPDTSKLLYQQAEKVRSAASPPPASAPPSQEQAAVARQQAGMALPLMQRAWFWPAMVGSTVLTFAFIWWRRKG